MADVTRDLPVVAFASLEEWDTYLTAEAPTSKGLWLKLAKKASGVTSVSQQEAIDCAVCHGWIDGQLDKFDETYWLVRFTPRKPNSKWSAANCARALRLIDQKRMKPAGLTEIKRAKADGRWVAAYPSQSKATIPDDLQIALDANARAKNFFETLDGTNRYAILHRVHTAKKAETRAQRIDKYVAMLSRGETIYPGKPQD